MIASCILLALVFLNLGIYLAKHGEPKTGKYNFGLQLISTAIELTLFYYAGLFDCFIE